MNSNTFKKSQHLPNILGSIREISFIYILKLILDINIRFQTFLKTHSETKTHIYSLRNTIIF